MMCVFMVLCESIFCQNSSFVASKQNDPIVKRGRSAHHMNRYSKHAVMYFTHTLNKDSLYNTITDSLRYINDTLLIRLCDTKTKGCCDTLIPKTEAREFINNSYWLKIPITRLYKIRSKLQPIARLSSTAVVLSYAAFISGIVIGVSSRNMDTQALGATLFIVGNAALISSLSTNILFAKKRFKFNKLRF